MWATTLENVYELVIPFPNKTAIDVTPQMIQKKWTAKDLARKAEDFFVSLNLSAMPPEFWSGSILEKPVDREIICHARLLLSLFTYMNQFKKIAGRKKCDV